jgi:hypothetical protein
MWDRYGTGEESVAVVSTLARLRATVPERVDVGHVDYVNFETEMFYSANPSHRAFQKILQLQDEREVRAVISDPTNTNPDGKWSIVIKQGEERGYHVSVDVAGLIESVVISPRSQHIIDEIRDLIKRHGLNVEVRPSTLSAPPVY